MNNNSFSDNPQAAQQLLENLEYCENIVSTIPEPILVLDADLRIELANQSFYRVFSATQEDTQGKLIYELAGGHWNIPQLRELLENILPRNTSFEDFEVNHEFPRLGKRIMLLNARRMHNGGQTDKILLAIEDITERKKIEKETESSELRYRRLFETAQDGILIINADSGRITDSNPFLSEMLGYTREEFLGKRLWEIGPFKDSLANREAFLKLQEKGYIRYEDLPLETKDGCEMQVEFVSNVYAINGDKVIQCNIRDITARKKAELALLEAKKNLEEKVRRRTAKLHRANKQLGIYALEIIRAHEDERKQVALELHDQIGQTLTYLKMMLTRISKSPVESRAVITEAQTVLGELLRQVRDMALNLRPSMLDDLGLLPTIIWHLENYTNQTKVKVNFEHSGLNKRFNPDISITVYRIVQESLTNIARYAKVDQADLSVWADEKVIHLVVKDLGQGFNTAGITKFKSTGLRGMRDRVLVLGGNFKIESSPGEGTSIIAEMPFSVVDNMVTNADNN
jgi:PAS domain S-box-containing protein